MDTTLPLSQQYISLSGCSLSTAPTATSVIGRLIDMTQCRYCKQKLRDARLLPCHHSYCSNCISKMISTSISKDEFFCPRDNLTIKIPVDGVTAFERDKGTQELEEVIVDLKSVMLDELDTNSANLDINLENLSKGVKDIELASVLSQHAVNISFDNIFKIMKKRQEDLLSEIKRKSRRQILNLEFEKYRLIEIKKSQSVQKVNSALYVEELFEPFNVQKRVSTPPSQYSSFSRQCRYEHAIKRDASSTLLSCHIGQQHLEFLQNDTVLDKFTNDLKHIGLITCDFDLKVKLERNLLALNEYPFGMKIGGNETDQFDWIASQPKGLTNHLGSITVITNSGRNEVVILDSTFNVKNIFSGQGRFVSCSDVTCCGNNIYVADEDACQVVMLSMDGSVIKRFGKKGTGALELQRPNGITCDSGGRIIVSDSLNHRIKVLSSDLQKCVLTLTHDKKKYSKATNFNFPCGVTTDTDDNIYVTDSNNARVVMLSKKGRFMKEFCLAGCHDPRSVAVSSDYKILLADRKVGKIFVCDGNGISMSCISGITDNMGTIMRFEQPNGVIVSGTDRIIVTDAKSNAVYIF